MCGIVHFVFKRFTVHFFVFKRFTVFFLFVFKGFAVLFLFVLYLKGSQLFFYFVFKGGSQCIFCLKYDVVVSLKSVSYLDKNVDPGEIF